MKKNLLLLFLFSVSMFFNFSSAQSGDTLCTPNPSKEAVALYRYLNDIKGEKILSGQMWVQWGVNEMDYVFTNTGKKPAIAGFDFINSWENAVEVTRAREYWKNGGIPTIMYHMGAPGKGDGYNASQETIDIDKCFQSGTTEYTEFWSDLNRIANHLESLRDSGVPVLWRPFHELDGGWFWWSKEGPEKFKQLWTTMFDYFVHDRGLNNLIWVLCYTSKTENYQNWYPGDEYVDIAGGDVYGVGSGTMDYMYAAAKNVSDKEYPITYHECGVPPNPDQCLTDGAMWSWFMEWHTGHLTGDDDNGIQNVDYLNYVYNHNLVITLDELPDIMADYGWDTDSCTASTINPSVLVDEGTWQTGNTILTGSGTTGKFRVETDDDGTWSWNGYGTSGSSTEQSVTINGLGSATATFTNYCGAVSTQSFHVAYDCNPAEIIPSIRINEEVLDTNAVTIQPGQTLTLSPQSSTEGTWSWTGTNISSNERELSVSPVQSITLRCYLTNQCGVSDYILFKIKVVASSDIPSSGKEPDVTLFPSPCNEYLQVTMNNHHKETVITVYRTDGRLVMEEKTNENAIQLNTGPLSGGTYIIRITNSENEFTGQFIKMK